MPGSGALTTRLRAFAPLLGYLAFVAWLTWPLPMVVTAALPFTHAPCRFDPLYSTWVMAYETRALLTAPLRLADAPIFHPTPGALFYGQLALAGLPIFAPVLLATRNPTLAANATFLGGLVLTATAMHVVVRRWTGSAIAGVVAATTVLLNQWMLWDFVPTAPHWATLYALPILAFAARRPATSLRRALVLVPVVVFQSFTDLVYLPPAVFGPLGALAGWRVLRPSTRAAGLRLALALGLALLVLAPFYLGYRNVRAANPNLAQQTSWRTSEAAFPAALPQRYLTGPWPFLFTPASLALIALGAVAALDRRRAGATPPAPYAWEHGLLWAGVGGFLSLTPVVFFHGSFHHTPLTLLQPWIPIFEILRVPSRVGVAGQVGLGILVGVATSEIRAALARRGLRAASLAAAGLVLAGAVLVANYRAYAANYHVWPGEPGPAMPRRYPTQPAPTVPAPLSAALATSPGPLLELPLGGQGGTLPDQHARAMYHAIAHRHPLLNGYSSYWPAAFPVRMALAARLPDQDALDALVRTTGLTLVWVHRDRLPPDGRAAWEQPPHGADRPSLAPLAASGDELLFVVRSPAHEAAQASSP